MPVMQAIVLDDAKTTPVAHSFDPMSLRNDLGTYSDRTGVAIQLRPSITISVRPANNGNQGHKVVLKLVYPHARTDSEGECCVPNGTPLPTSQFTVEFVRNKIATDADYNDLLGFLQQVVKDPQFTAVTSGESLR